VLYSYFYCKPILKISQAKGLRDPELGIALSPFVFIKAKDMKPKCMRALPGETKVLRFSTRNWKREKK